jgi:hypothetical protein
MKNNVNNVLLPGNRVRLTGYGPFRGLSGAVIAVNTIVDDQEDPFCFYLVKLEGTMIKEPIWFEYHEVEFIGSPAMAAAL